MNDRIYVVDTSDSRMFYAMRAIADAGKEVISYNNYHDAKSAIYCYSPSKRFSNEDLANINDHSALIAGALTQESVQALEKRNIKYYNLHLDEVFAYENAIQTAEAALMLIIRATNMSLFRQRLIIYGYGRLGRALANIFSSLKLNFAICTNDYYERAQAHLACRDVYDLDAPISDADVIVNTVPARIFGFDKLVKFKKSCYILDLASFSAIDNTCLESLELNYDNALGLPGKYSPKSAGEILAKAILSIDV